jgi:GT2 family glycosyltransferase
LNARVTVVLVNWNGEAHLQAFLPFLFRTEYPHFSVVLIDNASTDDSVAWVKAHFPQIHIEQLDRNTGFAEGNNTAFARGLVKTPYAVLLNTDVEVSPDWLAPLVQVMDQHPDVAAVQPKIRSFHHKERFEYAGACGGYLDCWGYPFCRGRIFDDAETDTGQYDTEADIFWATGACMMVRTSIVEEMGLFDARYFAHWEEIDFCWRAQNAGYRIRVVPSSVVYHVGGGTLPKNNPRKVFLNFRNSLVTLLKNLPLSEAVPIIFMRLVLDGVAAMKGLLAGDVVYLWTIARSHFSFYTRIPYALRSRRKLKQRPYRSLQGVYGGSVVWHYFVRKVKTFRELE